MKTTLTTKNLLPNHQPFNKTPWNYTGNEQVQIMSDSIVDWVLVMARSATGTILEQQAAMLDTQGNLRDTSGKEGIVMTNTIGTFLSIHHPSHVAVLSTAPYTGTLYDFTINDSDGQLKLIDNQYCLYAGDYDGSGVINSQDFNLWIANSAALNQYLPIDGDGNGIINNLDFNIWNNNRSKIGHPYIRY